jgi:hypothetical protein
MRSSVGMCGIRTHCDACDLNWRGSQGWELVSFAPRVKSVISGSQGGDMVEVFKGPGLGSFDEKVAIPPDY